MWLVAREETRSSCDWYGRSVANRTRLVYLISRSGTRVRSPSGTGLVLRSSLSLFGAAVRRYKGTDPVCERTHSLIDRLVARVIQASYLIGLEENGKRACLSIDWSRQNGGTRPVRDRTCSSIWFVKLIGVKESVVRRISIVLRLCLNRTCSVKVSVWVKKPNKRIDKVLRFVICFGACCRAGLVWFVIRFVPIFE